AGRSPWRARDRVPGVVRIPHDDGRVRRDLRGPLEQAPRDQPGIRDCVLPVDGRDPRDLALTRNLEKVKAGPVVAEPEGSDMSLRKVPRPFDLHWGKGVIAEEASVVTPFHEPAIQLLAFEDGSRSLRFCAYHKGSFARMLLRAFTSGWTQPQSPCCSARQSSWDSPFAVPL